MNILFLSVYILLIMLNFFYGITRNRIININEETGILTKKYKRSFIKGHFISLALLVFLAFIVSTNKENPDYITYKWIYESGMQQVEPGWKIFEKIAINLGLQYDEFKTTIIIISFFLIFIGLISLKVNENIILSLYAFYPFIMDAIQIRNFLSTAILIYSFHHLLSGQKKGKIIYTILILLASTIQSLFPIYLVLLFIDFNNSKAKRNKIIGLLVTCSLFALFLLKASPGLIASVGEILFSSRTDKMDYYVQNNIGFGFLVFGFMQALFTVSAYCSYKDNTKITNKNLIIAKSIFWIDLMLICTLPLLTIHIEFYRIFRNLCLLNYTVFPILLNRRKDKKYLFGMFCFVVAFGMYIMMDYFSYEGRFTYVFVPFFR